MSKKITLINPNSPEQLLNDVDKIRAILEHTGGWYNVTGSVQAAHYFVKGNEKSDCAISLCAEQVVLVEKLHAPTEGKHCMVCSLMIGAGKAGDFQANLARRRANALTAQALAERLKNAEKLRKSK